MLQQYVANGLLAGSITALLATGFLIVYQVGKFFHFAHAAVIAFAAYCVLGLSRIGINSPTVRIVLAVTLSCALGILMELAVYRYLRERRGGGMILLIAAIGIYTIIQNSVALLFGDDTRSFRWWSIEPGWTFFGVKITTVQLAIIGISWTLVALTWMFINYSPIGKSLRAVANDPELSQIVGVNVEINYVWAIGLASFLAGIGGILVACDVDLSPTMGVQPMMMAVVAVLVGGGVIWGTACSALLIGMAQNIGVIWLPTQWQDAITFTILLIFLVLRSHGVFAKMKRRVPQ